MRCYHFCVWKNKERLDKLLVFLFPHLSRSLVQELIKQKKILIRGKKATAHYIPKRKDNIELTIPPLQTIGIIPSPIPLDILYEDKDIIVVNKQPGIVVHPSDNGGHITDSIVNALLYHRPKEFSINNTNRPGIVHRLDKDTSGVLLITKNDQAMNDITNQWQQHLVKKIYMTLVAGNMHYLDGVIQAPIGRSHGNRKTMSIRIGKGGRYAQTSYHVNHIYEDSSLLTIHILTGRTHQIRVHCKSIGHPVVGDTTYGNKKINEIYREKYGLLRQFLHAHQLAFRLPSHKRQMVITAPIPHDLRRVLNNLPSKN